MEKADTGKVKVVREDTLIVAVDIGMEMNRGILHHPRWNGARKLLSLTIPGLGMDKLWDMIMASKNRFKCNEVIVGYESTGPYGEPMLHYLVKKPVKSGSGQSHAHKEGKGD